MLKTLFLISLLGILVAFLLWRKTPRAIALETVFISGWVFAVSYWITEEAIYRLNSDLLDGWLPYLPPLLPVCIFVMWFLPRARKVMT
jgi:hypothetical protein